MNRLLSLVLSVLTVLFPVLTGTNSGDYEKMTSFKDSLYVLFNKKEVTGEYHTGEKSTDVFDESQPFSLSETVTLTKEKGKDFKILTLDDIHFSDYGYRAFFSIFNVNKIKRLVKRTNPDLIIMPGDFVCGGDGNSDYYSIQRITDLMESFGVPWAPVFGNHDDETNCDLNFLADTMMKSPHCLMQKGDERMGVGNYIINVVEEGTENIVESIFMMDSHHSQPNELQQKWFKRAAEGINALTSGKAEISLFMHIPIPEYQTMYAEAWNSEKKCWNDGYDAYGSAHETVCCEFDADGNPYDRGFFDIIKEVGAKYVFCGHDHMNDFSAVYEGVRLTYLMKLGQSSGFQPFFDGGSVITIGDSGISRITHIITLIDIMINLVDIEIK